jgi:hypothetical protein
MNDYYVTAPASYNSLYAAAAAASSNSSLSNILIESSSSYADNYVNANAPLSAYNLSKFQTMSTFEVETAVHHHHHHYQQHQQQQQHSMLMAAAATNNTAVDRSNSSAYNSLAQFRTYQIESQYQVNENHENDKEVVPCSAPSAVAVITAPTTTTCSSSSNTTASDISTAATTTMTMMNEDEEEETNEDEEEDEDDNNNVSGDGKIYPWMKKAHGNLCENNLLTIRLSFSYSDKYSDSNVFKFQLN